MAELTYRGKTILFTSVTGVVLDTDKRSETRVFGGGGGGYIGQNGGTINPVSISSTTKTLHEFWIKTENGEEKAIQLEGVDIPLRAGQKVTLIQAEKKGGQLSWYATLINHNANKRWTIQSPRDLNDLMRLERFGYLPFIIAIPIWLAVAIVLNSGNAGLWAAGGFLAYTLFITQTRIKKLAAEIQSKLDSIASQSEQRL